MTDQEKTLKTMNEIRNRVIFWGIYLLLTSTALLLLILNRPNNITDERLLTLYWFVGNLIVLTLIFFIYNLLLFKNSNRIRDLAIKKYDEMTFNQNQKSNSLTLRLLILISLFMLIISVPLNQVDLFNYSFITIAFIITLKFVSNLIYKIKDRV